MANRLSLLVSRHQREVKILTAARTLQKLNNNNKRMSKQTMESLEQSEKRVEAAEKVGHRFGSRADHTGSASSQRTRGRIATASDGSLVGRLSMGGAAA